MDDKGSKVIIRELGKIIPFDDLCGEIRVMSSAEDFAEANIAVATMIMPSEPHYHRKATEFYYCLEGEGKLVVGHDVFIIEKGTMAIIPPMNVHFTIPRTKVNVLAVSAPAWSLEDQISAVSTNPLYTDHLPFGGKKELINELKELACMQSDELTEERFLELKNGWKEMPDSDLRNLLSIRK